MQIQRVTDILLTVVIIELHSMQRSIIGVLSSCVRFIAYVFLTSLNGSIV